MWVTGNYHVHKIGIIAGIIVMKCQKQVDEPRQPPGATGTWSGYSGHHNRTSLRPLLKALFRIAISRPRIVKTSLKATLSISHELKLGSYSMLIWILIYDLIDAKIPESVRRECSITNSCRQNWLSFIYQLMNDSIQVIAGHALNEIS